MRPLCISDSLEQLFYLSLIYGCSFTMIRTMFKLKVVLKGMGAMLFPCLVVTPPVSACVVA